MTCLNNTRATQLDISPVACLTDCMQQCLTPCYNSKCPRVLAGLSSPAQRCWLTLSQSGDPRFRAAETVSPHAHTADKPTDTMLMRKLVHALTQCPLLQPILLPWHSSNACAYTRLACVPRQPMPPQCRAGSHLSTRWHMGHLQQPACSAPALTATPKPLHSAPATFHSSPSAYKKAPALSWLALWPLHHSCCQAGPTQ